MFSKAEKINVPVFNRSQAHSGPAFFRKADEENYSGEQSQSAFFSTPVQAKLNVSHPDDPQEKEADTVAGQVMRAPEPVTGSEVKKEEEIVHTKLSSYHISRSEIEGEEEHAASEGSEASTTIQKKAGGSYLPGIVQRSGRGPPGGIMHFEKNLQSSKGYGSPLPASTLQFMQSRFKADFTDVRVHTGGYAEDLSNSVHAQAFTHGHDIYFNSGKYSPHTEAGGTLLAHELTHTIQQGAVRTDGPVTEIRESVQRKNIVQRVPAVEVPQLTNAVEKAKSKEGKVNAGKEGPDGYREGWQDLLEFFKSTFGPDKIISGAGGTIVPGTVAEMDIKKKRTATGMIVNKDDVNGDRITGERDAMPSWCGIFVFWALNTSGVPMPKWKLGRSVIKPGAAYPGGYVPRAGDIAYKEGYSHYAIVESANGSSVRTVNGNTSGEDNLGGQIQTREHPISNWTAFFNPLLNMEGTLGSGESPAEKKPKTLRELRQDLFHVNRSKDTSEEIRLKEEEKEEEKVDEEMLHSSKSISTYKTEERIQNGWFDTAISFVNSAIDYVAEGLEAGKRLILNEARDFVMAIPGYKALRVVLGEDPITGEEIARNGRNFIEAAFDIMPGGNLLFDKLNELGALEEAAQWIDNGIAAVESLVASVVSRVETFWNGLTLESLASPGQIFRDVGNIIHSTISDIINFAVETGRQLLEIIKRWLLTQVVDFIKERTTAYPLLTVILGKDPLTEVEVARNGTNILNALLELGGEEGKQQRRQMQETGTFGKVAGWIDRGILVFGNLYQTIRENFGLIWSVVSIEALMHPVEKFTEIYNTFAAPVRDVLRFVADTAVIILQFIKEVLMIRLSNWAKGQRGYFLLTVILGKDPFTNAVVDRNTENIIHGFMSLMQGGEEQFAQMKESGSIARATEKIEAAVATLNMTPAYIVSLFIGLWNSFSLNDLVHPADAFLRIFNTLSQPITRLVAFVIEIVKIVVVVILEIMKFPFDLINNIIARTVKSFHLIKADPIGFLKNLLRAIKEGFIQFFDNILTHLINGLVGWLTMELKDAGVPELKDLSLKGIISWVLEVLGISMEKIWDKLAKHPKIGPAKVAKIRGMINTLEGIWKFIKDVQERGIVAIWDKISEQLSNLWTTILDAVKNWIMEKIITRVTAKLLSMLDPTGIMAVVNSCIAIYNAIQSFIKYLRQMLEIVNSFVEGVAEIASGSTKKAADFLERTMARGIPIVIGFLANQVGLSGIGRRIGEMIEKVREMVDNALDWLVNKAVETGGRLLEMGRAAAGTVMGWLGFRERFTTQGGIDHTIYVRQAGRSASLIIESSPMDVLSFLNQKQLELTADTVIAASEKNAKLGRITHAKNLLQGLQALMNDNSSANNPRIPQMITEVISVVREIDAGGTSVIPPLAAQFQPGFSNGVKAASFNARFMHKGGTFKDRTGNNVTVAKNHPDGSEPGNQTLPDAFRILTDMRLNNRWVRFHIVNADFGGAGMDSNLIPTPNYINNPEYLHEFENPLKNHYNNSLPIWIQANISYRPQFSGFFPLQYNANGGAMKFNNNQWVPDGSKQVSFNKSIDLPESNSFNINYLITNPSELTLLVNLSTVVTAMFEILRDNQPPGGYTYYRQLERALAKNILGPDAISLDEAVINNSAASTNDKRKARDYKTRLGSVNWTF